jgi:uncharacterized protein YyaL (SSP411 family)
MILTLRKMGWILMLQLTLVLICRAEPESATGDHADGKPGTKEMEQGMHEKEYQFTNRLIDETSPYLLQHAHNPVDWYPWGKEAFKAAEKDNRPIFLSIGYAACHWCHVMEHESFENEAIAKIMNENFINIKVDREERPDIDDIYMAAVQMMTGSGGWPMSVFLNPGGEPFFGGTYFPPESRHGRPGFRDILLRVTEVYKEKGDELAQDGSRLTQAITESTMVKAGDTGLTQGIVDTAVRSLRGRFDSRQGGFGSAPKFPPSMALNLLLLEYQRTGNSDLLGMVELTLQKMAQGGMYDQAGGGFHRYSTDEVWLVPHFEKMLYDNALLAPVYLDAWLLTGNDYYLRISREILDYVLEVMTHEDGGYYSTQDADSEKIEGKYYTWRPDEIKSIFGEEDGKFFCEFYDIKDGGNWHEAFNHSSILNIKVSMDDFSKKMGIRAEEGWKRIDPLRRKLVLERNKRIPPLLDDKIITAWNGMMISAMARGTQVTGDPVYAESAERAVQFILKHLRTDDGGLLRTWRGGKAKIPAFVGDYAYFINGLLDLYEARFDLQLLMSAEEIAREMLKRFYDPDSGGFFTTDGRDTSVVLRLKDFYDGAIPSGNSTAVHALHRLSVLFDSDEFRKPVDTTLGLLAGRLKGSPGAYHQMIQAVAYKLNPGKEIVVSGKLEDETTRELIRNIWNQYLPGGLLVVSTGEVGPVDGRIPLLKQKTAIEGKPTVYVCQNYVCKRPVHDVQSMLELLKPATVSTLADQVAEKTKGTP